MRSRSRGTGSTFRGTVADSIMTAAVISTPTTGASQARPRRRPAMVATSNPASRARAKLAMSEKRATMRTARKLGKLS